MTRQPQVLESVEVKEKKPIEKIKRVSDVIKAVTDKLGASGRVLVRYSGTENLARVMVEGENLEEITRYMKDIVAAIQSEIGKGVGN